MIAHFAKSREAILLAAIAALLALIASRFPSFVGPANLVNVFNDTSPLILLALGQMVVILTRCIDLSVAAQYNLSESLAIAVAAKGPVSRNLHDELQFTTNYSMQLSLSYVFGARR